MQPHPLLPIVGTHFHEHYRIVGCIGVGGMGAIYEVIDERTARRRALKVLLPSLVENNAVIARFRQEAVVTANLPGEHLVEVLDAGIDEASRSPFLVMELLRGVDLGQHLEASGRIPVAEMLSVLRQIASGLEKTHAVGVVHRDVKPSNIFLVARDGEAPLVKILDFGVAKIMAESSTAAGTTRSVGTPLYMAPEQIEGDGWIDGRADIYALAQLAYTMLVGRPYYADELRSGAVYGVLLQIMRDKREAASSRALRSGVQLPLGFDAWFSVATSIAPHERYQTAPEAISALEMALVGGLSRKGTRSRLLVPFVLLSLGLGGLGVGLAAVQRPAVLAASSPSSSPPRASSSAEPSETVVVAPSAEPAPSAPVASSSRPEPAVVASPPRPHKDPPGKPASASAAEVYDPTDVR